ncbi:MAG: DUF1737 domain-containing protein [Lentisphaeraceae bacterium]|nr:DUF1737 domain-containing protein [Lentisphaeraceae bacterium]
MTEYKIVFNHEGEAFDEMVSECLNAGWSLYGNPWAHQEPSSGMVHLYQAIMRELTYEPELEEEIEVMEEEIMKSNENIQLPPTENKIKPLG